MPWINKILIPEPYFSHIILYTTYIYTLFNTICNKPDQRSLKYSAMAKSTYSVMQSTAPKTTRAITQRYYELGIELPTF